MSTLLACGVAVLDVQQTVDRLPGPDEKLVASDLLVCSGGPAANAAVTAAALGVGARLVTRIGDSPLGRLISSDLAAYGVEVVDRADPLDQPAVSTVLVTRGTGQRAVDTVSPSLAWAARVAADSCTAPGARSWLTDQPRLAAHRQSLAGSGESSGPSAVGRSKRSTRLAGNST